MTTHIPDEYLVDHYPTDRERFADGWIHALAIAAAAGGAMALTEVALAQARPDLAMASTLHGAGLIAMFGLSAAYNLTSASPLRPLLRRLDEAGIFLMVAASHTLFTTQVLQGPWQPGPTAAVWALAAAGMAAKLALPEITERTWTALYLLFGWVALLALDPVNRSLPPAALSLLVAGGLAYTVGSSVFLTARLPYRRAAWHGFVAVGAALQYAAVLFGAGGAGA